MKNKPAFKMIIPLLGLIAASIACKIPDVRDMVEEAITEKCTPVDRATYERAAAELSRTPQTPNFPESAVYEVCTNMDDEQGGYTSIRMTNDYPPGENAATEGSGTLPKDADSTKGDKEQNESEQIRSFPAGTYAGKFPGNFPEYYQVTNEINLIVSENGSLSGSAILKSSYTMTHNTSSGGQCTSYHEFSTSYAVSGQVKDAWTKTARVDKTLNEITDRSNCGRENTRRDETCTCEASAEIKDGVLTITCGYSVDCGAYLTAAK